MNGTARLTARIAPQRKWPLGACINAFSPQEALGTNRAVELATKSRQRPWSRLPFQSITAALLRTAGFLVALAAANLAQAAEPAIAAGRVHSLALDTAGQVWAWGANAAHQLGLTAEVSRSETPRRVPGLPPIRTISAYRDQSLALDHDGSVWAWGAQSGAVGPQKLNGLPTIVAIAQGAFHALFLTDNGQVWVWGQNANCQYGNGTVGDGTVLAPAVIPGLEGVTALATGYDRSYARKHDGSIWVWGCLFDDFRKPIYEMRSPAPKTSLDQVWPIAVGLFDDAGIGPDGQLASWGVQASIQLATSDMFALWSTGVSGGRLVAMGTHLLFLRQDGTAGGLFNNGYGQLGTGQTGWASSAVEAAGITAMQGLAAGDNHSLLLDGQGQVFAAGDNSQGQTATPGSSRVTRFQQVTGENGVGFLALGTGSELGRSEPAQEFFHATLAHYFMTASAAEIIGIDAGAAGAGWARTAYAFRVWPQAHAQTTPVCRFYGNPALGSDGQRMGPNSHFYTADPVECELTKSDPGWLYEGVVFHAAQPVAGRCPGVLRPLYRSYNNRYRENDSNHRYLVDPRLLATMASGGWSAEGVVMCLPW